MSMVAAQSRVAAYIDGFNLYHAINDLGNNRLKWINLRTLASRLLRPNETLAKVHYFTTVVDWNAPKEIRHIAFVAAQEANDVVVSHGTFKRSLRHCATHGNHCPFREEKQTDVSIAVNIVADSFADVFDRMILITADTDQIPAVRMVNATFPHKLVTWAAPPKRLQAAREMGQLMPDRLEITAGMLGTCRLPKVVLKADGTEACRMPIEYA